MANNTPITARISKGLFGKSSNKVTEPLLNVGPAGVSGNNQTKDVPSPSKMKSVFKMMSSPFKQTDTEKKPKVTVENSDGPTAKVSVGVAGQKGTPPIMETGSAGKSISESYVPNENAWWRSRTPKQKAEHNVKKRAELAAADAAASSSAGKEREVVPGTPDKPGEVIQKELYMRDKGDAQTALDRRDVIRSGKVAARQTKRAEINVGKAEAEISGLKGKEKRKDAKTVKNTAKLNQATTNLAVAQGQATGAKAQSEQNIKGTSTKDVYGKQRLVGKGDETTATQESRIRDEVAANATANGSKATKSAFDNTFKKEVVKESDKFSTEAKKVKTVAEKKDNGFFAKKSPMKLKYFK
jgi:hypothetical protein